MASLVALLVGGFIVYNALAIAVAQRRREIGILRAAGMRRRDVLGMIVGESLALGRAAEPDDLLARGAELVAVTLGRRGAVLSWADGREDLAQEAIPVSDATGAGDAFFAAVSRTYDELAAADPDRWIVLDASRPPDEVLADAEWLAADGVREVVLVSENSSSYGKDLGDIRLLETLLPELAAVPGVERVRVSYLQPAETRPGLVAALAGTPGVAPYFDLSFQHASGPVLRRMRRFGSTGRFLELLASVRELAAEAGARSNVIVGFPGETRADVDELVRFLEAARLDAVGVFSYSDEDGTEAAGMPGKVGAATVARRYARVAAIIEELCAQRAQERVGSTVDVLVDEVSSAGVEGRAAHQAPEVDGSTTLVAGPGSVDPATLRPGDLVRATVTGSEGVDLVAVARTVLSPAAHDGD
jgi:hypothetical protein